MAPKGIIQTGIASPDSRLARATALERGRASYEDSSSREAGEGIRGTAHVPRGSVDTAEAPWFLPSNRLARVGTPALLMGMTE